MFHRVRVARIVEETADAKSIVLDVPPALAADFAYRAGQFLTVELELGGERLRRCYSLASSPDCDPEHKVTVKRTSGGRVSNWLNDSLCAGDILSVLAPEGRFVLDGGDAPLLLFAGGSGITPVVSLVKSALAKTERRVTLLYANRDARSVIFAEELARLERAHAGRLRVVHHHDEARGILDEAAIGAVASEQLDAACYLCGPAPFMALVERALSAAGIPEERIRVERFVFTPHANDPPPPAPDGAETPEFVDVVLEGKQHRVPYTPGKTLLQTARDAGLNAPYSCEEGFCGCCASDLLEGRVVMAADDALSNEEKRRGMILACQSRPVTRRCAFRFVG
ncbi:MAG TPA: ferredoxin--NADP reductase [Polyangiaceae bacterium]|jgi:3-ketosteroid 9alpha-monooxygenase subunit B